MVAAGKFLIKSLAVVLCLLAFIPCSDMLISSPGNPALSKAGPAADSGLKSAMLQAYVNLPSFFIANRGQADSTVLYYAPVKGGMVSLTAGGIVFNLTRNTAIDTPAGSRMPNLPDSIDTYRQLVLRMNFDGANANPAISGKELIEGNVNYFEGSDPAGWLTGIPTYQEVVYRDIYPGIDLRLYGKCGSLTYDFIVHPGGSIDDIRLSMDGIDRLSVDGKDLIAGTAFGDIRQQRLRIYQEKCGTQINVDGNFRLLDNDSYGFAVAGYDMNKDIVIDPALIYSTYLGGAAEDQGFTLVIDPAGCAYVTGYTNSNPFPTTAGAVQTTYGGGGNDAFVTKLNPGGSGMVYSTYLGGAGDDRCRGLAVDAAGNAYVTGYTSSSITFPLTSGAFQTTYGGGAYDAFITKLNAAGNALLYSTFLGGEGNDYGYSVVADSGGDAVVTGYTNSSAFPITLGAFQITCHGGYDAFVTKLNAAGNALVYSSYLGGSGTEYGYDLAVDTSGCAYITGSTTSDNTTFPFTAGAYQTIYRGSNDAFISKFNAAGSALIYSTFLGGSEADTGNAIAIDSSDNAYITGNTTSNTFPTTPGVLQAVYGGGGDAFITKLNAAGNALVYSTYLGGADTDNGQSIVLDTFNNAYVTGYTSSHAFPTTPGAYQGTYNGGATDAFIARLNPGASTLLYSTFLGGTGSDYGYDIAVDTAGNIYVTGQTGSNPFPTTAASFQPTYQGGTDDSFISKFQLIDPPAAATGEAMGATANYATLNAMLTSLGTAPSVLVSFQYGSTPGSYTDETSARAVSNIGLFSAVIDLSGLSSYNSALYYRARAVGDYNLTVYGQERSFIIPRAHPLLATTPHGASTLTLTPAAPPISLPNVVVQSASLSPLKVSPGSQVTVTSTVLNKGTVNGSLNIKLYVNGEEEAARSVTLESGKTAPVNFTISRGRPGTYTVYVGSTPAGSFTVDDLAGPNIILFMSAVLIFFALTMGLVIIRKR